MDVFVHLFLGMVGCFVAFVVAFFHARATGIPSRAAIVLAGAWASAVAGVGAAIIAGRPALAALALAWLWLVRRFARSEAL